MSSIIKRHKKLYIILLSVALVISIIFTANAVFKYYHPTHQKYNDRFIIGNSIDAIEKRYGELEIHQGRDGYAMAGCYLASKGVPDISLETFFGAPLYDQFYWIYFDENNIAQKVELEESW